MATTCHSATLRQVPPCATSKVAWVPLLSFFCRDIYGVFVCLWQLVCVFVVSKDVNEAYDVVPSFPLLGIWTYNHEAQCEEGGVMCSMQFLRLRLVEVVMMSTASVCKQNLFAFLRHLTAPNSIASISRSNMWRDGSNIKAYIKLRSNCFSTNKRKPLSIGSFAQPMMF